VPKPAPSKTPKRPVLWVSNSATAGTGYGQQTAQVTQRLHKAGHSTAIASNYGQEAVQGEWHGIRVLPRGFDMYSNDVVGAYQQLWTHENGGMEALVVTLFDVWVFSGPPWDRIPKIASWVPIDHTPVPPKVLEWLRRDNVVPIAMSQFGSDELTKCGLEHHYVPHAIEKTFKPTPYFTAPDDRQVTGRQIMGFDEDHFVILMNAANKGAVPARKSWDTNLLAVAMFMREHEDARLFLHTERDGAMGGINLPLLLKAVGIPEHKVNFTEPFAYRMGLPQEMLAAMYSDANVLLACALGEGFGIPVIEAAATGLRTIVGNWTASPELVGEGFMVDGQPSWDPMQSAWWMVPNIPSTLDALEKAYAAPRGASQAQITHAAKYDADYVFNNQWKPVLEALG
jgi:hypothetical protein